MAYLLLLLLIIVSVHIIRQDQKEYAALDKARSTKQRQAIFQSWYRKSYLVIGLPGLIIVLLYRKWAYLYHPFWSNSDLRLLQSQLQHASVISIVAYIALLFLLATVEQGIITVLKTRRQAKLRTVTIGKIQALLPQNSEEQWSGIKLSIAAGINEELLFRIALPVLLLQVLPNAQWAIGVAAVWFGLVHIYQGVVGVVGATLLGGLLMYIYLSTGNIGYAMMAHAMIDLQGLAVQPWLARQTLKFMKQRKTLATN